jgi:hypothetical protein
LPQLIRQFSTDTLLHLATSLSHFASQIGISAGAGGSTVPASAPFAGGVGATGALAIGVAVASAGVGGATLEAGVSGGLDELGGAPAHAASANEDKAKAKPRRVFMARNVARIGAIWALFASTRAANASARAVRLARQQARHAELAARFGFGFGGEIAR